jgi:hypothetical protein
MANGAEARTRERDRPRDGASGDMVRSASPTTVSEQDIARRAFEIYQERGAQDGRALEDWVQAKHDLGAES